LLEEAEHFCRGRQEKVAKILQYGPANWAMVLPVRLSFEKESGVGTVLVVGASSDFRMQLPMRPRKVELDPDHWIMSEKTSTKRN
jgi:hypothetical protein